jgi:hypothetical protein
MPAARIIDPFDTVPQKFQGAAGAVAGAMPEVPRGPGPGEALAPVASGAAGAIIDPFDRGAPPYQAPPMTSTQDAQHTHQQTGPGFFESFFLGKGRTEFPDMKEFTAQTYSHANPGNLDQGSRDGLMEWVKNPNPDIDPKKIALDVGSVMAGDPAAYADIIEKQLPDAKRSQDKYGNPIIEWRGEKYYANKPGASGNDFTKFAVDLSAYAPAGAVANVFKSILMRAGVAFVGNAATSAGQDVVATTLGSKQGVSGERAGWAGLLGAGEKVAGPFFNSVRRAVMPTRFLDAQGAITPAGQKILDAAGYKVGQLQAEQLKAMEDYFEQLPSAIRNSLQTVEAGQLDEATKAVARGIVNKATEGFSKTAGQASGDFNQIAYEQAMRAGAHGRGPQQIMENFDKKIQAPEIRAYLNRTQADVAGGTSRAPTEYDAGAGIKQAIESAESTAAKAVDDAYEAVRNIANTDPKSMPRLSTENFSNVAKTVHDAVKSLDIVIDKKITPSAVEAMRDVGRVARLTGNARTKEVSLVYAERARRRLNAHIAQAKASGNAEDMRAAIAVRNSFDAWLDDAVENGLKSGDPQVYDMLKNARGLRRDYAKKFQSAGGDDEAGKVIERLASGNATNQEAVNFIIGASEIGAKQGAIRVAKRLETIFGRDSPEMGLLKEAAFMRMIYGPRMNVRMADAPQEFAQGIVSRMDEALSGRGREVMETLFTKSELANFALMRKEMGTLVVPTLGRNPSGTGAAVARIVGNTVSKFGWLGGPKGVAADYALRMTQASRNAAKAEAATKGFEMPQARDVPLFSKLAVPLGLNVQQGAGAADRASIRTSP